jgi:hypothetical protein
MVQPTAGRILQSVAEQRLNHDEMLALHDRLNDPELVGIPAIEKRIKTLLGQFDDNRIGTIGERQFGQREVAYPVWVKLHRKKHLVLCESFGRRNPALALNGANMDKTKPPITMDSLVYVRLVEKSFHDLMVAEFKQTRHQEVEFIDFDKRSEREKHRWFGDLYTDLMHRTDNDNSEMLEEGDP